jgi:hypothetical protein
MNSSAHHAGGSRVAIFYELAGILQNWWRPISSLISWSPRGNVIELLLRSGDRLRNRAGFRRNKVASPGRVSRDDSSAGECARVSRDVCMRHAAQLRWLACAGQCGAATGRIRRGTYLWWPICGSIAFCSAHLLNLGNLTVFKSCSAVKLLGRRAITARTPIFTASVSSADTAICQGADGINGVAGSTASGIRRFTEPTQMFRRCAGFANARFRSGCLPNRRRQFQGVLGTRANVPRSSSFHHCCCNACGS